MELVVSDKPIKSENIPASQGQLEAVRQELKGDITTLRLETKAGFQDIEARFIGIDAKFERIESILWGMKAMMEEQNTKILYALDGYHFLNEKVDRSEKRLGKLEQKVFGSEQN
jgi:hypothetical protein